MTCELYRQTAKSVAYRYGPPVDKSATGDSTGLTHPAHVDTLDQADHDGKGK